jgi:hypothetical protein
MTHRHLAILRSRSNANSENQIFGPSVEVGAALRFPALDLFGVGLDKPTAGFLDRGQGAAHCSPSERAGTPACSASRWPGKLWSRRPDSNREPPEYKV